MKKEIITLLLGIIVTISCLFCLSSCTNYESGSKCFDGFTIISTSDYGSTCGIKMYDNETKVIYLYLSGTYRGAMTVLVDENGKPLLYQGD